jgi:transcriptional regulator with XRE-family HTH domain
MKGDQGKESSGEISAILGHSLARHRLRQGLTQETVADRANLHRTEVGMIERGERMPRGDTLFQIIGALGIGLDEAYGGARWIPYDDKPGGYVDQG